MIDVSQIKEHQEVLGSDGEHVGKVDHIEPTRLKLVRNDPDAQGHHHYVPLEWVASVDEAIHLNKSRGEAEQQWQNAD